MKKINAVYFFFLLIGLVIMIGAISVIVVAETRFAFLLIVGIAVLAIMIVLSVMLSNGTFEQRKRLFKECIKCEKEIEYKSDYCRYCGAKQEAFIECDFCGTENHSSDTVCTECNAQLK